MQPRRVFLPEITPYPTGYAQSPSRIRLLKGLETITRVVGPDSTIALTSAADATGALGRILGLAQGLGFEKLSTHGVRWTLVEIVVSVTEIREVMNFFGLDEHRKSQ